MKLNWISVRVLDLDLLTTWSNLNFVSKAGAACLEGGNQRVETLDVKHYPVPAPGAPGGVHLASGASLSSRARFTGVCHGLNSTNSLVFDTRASGNIDRTSSVVVPGVGRCLVRSLAPCGGPPKNRNADVVLEPQAQ